jgi:hypothetical protein
MLIPSIFRDTVIYISVARKQLGKHVPAKKNSWPTIGKGLSIASKGPVNNHQLGALQQHQTSIARQRAVNKLCQK